MSQPSDDTNGKIFVGIPRERISYNQFIDNRDLILQRLHETGRLGGNFQAEGHRVDRNRDKITEVFMAHKDKPPWLMMIDTDMEHPITAPERLASYGLPVVGALYFHRGETHQPFVFKYAGLKKDQWGREIPHWAPMVDEVYNFLIENSVPLRDGAFVIDSPKQKAQVDCDAVATGCIIIHRSVLEKIPHPWFEYISGGNSEDLIFCQKVKEAGFSVTADLSTVCGHFHWVPMGQAQFRMNYESRGISFSSYSKGEAATMLEEFLKIDKSKALKMIEKSNAHMVAPAWNQFIKKHPGGNGDIDAFYRSEKVGRLYLLELLAWNFSEVFHTIRSLLTGIRNVNVIEVGAGIGTVSIQMTLQNNNVLAVEPNKLLRNFIDYRWGKVQDEISASCGELSIVDLNWKEKCLNESFDVAISLDTFEHMSVDELKSTMSQLYRVLKPNGKIAYHANWYQQDIYPMHFDHSSWFIPFCLELGFTEISPMELMKVK